MTKEEFINNYVSEIVRDTWLSKEKLNWTEKDVLRDLEAYKRLRRIVSNSSLEFSVSILMVDEIMHLIEFEQSYEPNPDFV